MLKVTREGCHNCDKNYKKSCKTCTSLSALISIILQLATYSQPQHAVEWMNIHTLPVIVNVTASPPANQRSERNDRLTNAWRTIAGKEPSRLEVRPPDRPTDRHQERGAAHCLAGFIAAATKLLVAWCKCFNFWLLIFVVVAIYGFKSSKCRIGLLKLAQQVSWNRSMAGPCSIMVRSGIGGFGRAGLNNLWDVSCILIFKLLFSQFSASVSV